MYPPAEADVQLNLDRCRAVLEMGNMTEPAGGWPLGAPVSEYLRSPVAARVAGFAAQSGLHLFHYEYREQWDLPLDWVPVGVSDEDALAPQWEGGVLPERKYHSFRHDQMVGGFNPGHRSKWSTHELCHGLVGFGYKPSPSPLFIATAGRLAELVPVVLWYFLDEIRLSRCVKHQGGGALFQYFCPACEASATQLVDDPLIEERLVGAKRFMERELAAVARTIRLGRPVEHQWATINLCSDGLAYAHAHGPRLRSSCFSRYAERFIRGGNESFSDLGELEERATSVFQALCGEQDSLEPWVVNADCGRLRWTIQDVGYRLSMLSEGLDGETHGLVESVLDELARACAQSIRGTDAEAISASVAIQLDRLQGLDEALGEGSRASVLATGYAIPEQRASIHLVREGIQSCTPLVSQLIEDAGDESLFLSFVEYDEPIRKSLGQRWASFLRLNGSELLAELASYELALLQARPSSEVAVLGAWASGLGRLSASYQLLRFQYPVVDLAARVESGALFGVIAQGHVRVCDETDQEPESSPVILLIGYEPSGELVLADIDPESADALEVGDLNRLEASTLQWLSEIGALEPLRWEF